MKEKNKEIAVNKILEIIETNIVTREFSFFKFFSINKVKKRMYTNNNFTANKIIFFIKEKERTYYYFNREEHGESLSSSSLHRDITLEILKAKYPDRTINNLIKDLI